MTPSRGPAATGASAMPTHLATSTPAAGRWLVVLFSLLWGAARGFVLAPCGVDVRTGQHGCGRRTSSPVVPAPTQGVCRMVADGGGDADEQNSDDDGSSGQSQGEARGEEKEGAGGVDQAQAPPQSQKLPELLKPSREELARDFPNPPKAPYQTLPDPRTYTPEQLLAGEMDVSYGGQPSARRANLDFERSERERIHFQTAARVLNYQIQADRKAMAEANKAGATAKTEAEDVPDHMKPDVWEPYPEELVDAVYDWDKNPKLITFSAFGVLYNYHIPIGLMMREALGRAHGYRHRLPGPDFFHKHYTNTYKETCYHIPCFGVEEKISSYAWWFHVFTDSMLKTIIEFGLDENIVFDVIHEVVDELYFEMMVGPEAFELVPHMSVVLNRLAKWRDEDGGPKLAVVANDDERLHVTLENMGILPYFDFVLTSREVGHEMPQTDLFDMALELADVKNPRKALHIGNEYGTDVTGSSEAGWEACCVDPRQSDFEKEGEPYEYHRLMRITELLNRFELPEVKPTYVSRRRGQFWEEPDESEYDEPDEL